MEEISGYEVAQLQTPTQAQLAGSFDGIERANVDIQVATAHQYPRNIARCLNNSIAIATMDRETAQTCGYALPRAGKPIMGPSVHLAKIIAQQFGNLRAEAKVVGVTDTQVISRGIAWDLENNYAVAFEVRRSIVGKYGRFSDDMITVTGNAANAIAYRNAVFAVVPKAITDKVYGAAQRLITGDLSDEEELIKRRMKAIRYFNDQYGITEEEVVKLCGKHTVNQIQADEIALLLGIQQSLKDGDTTVEEVMAPIRNSKEAKSNKLNDIAKNAGKRGKKEAAAQPKTQTEAQTAQSADNAENTIVDTETGEVKTAPAPAEGMDAPNPQI